MQKIFWRLLFLYMVAGGMGCTTVPESVTPPQATAPSSTILLNQDLIEKLDANQQELKHISKEMRLISEGHLFYGSDEQLGTIQKSSLYISLSKRTTMHQKDLIALVDYIRPDRRGEYAGLLIKKLEKAVFDLAYDLNFLNTYYAFIENQTARENIDKAAAVIRDDMDNYKQLIVELTHFIDSEQGNRAISQ